MGDLIRFHDVREFEAYNAANSLLRRSGFSIGSTQRGTPTAAMFGDYAVSKWRNLNRTERAETHATIEGDCRNGPVAIRLLPACPDEARARFLAEAGEMVS